jgi:hypothetical protein
MTARDPMNKTFRINVESGILVLSLFILVPLQIACTAKENIAVLQMQGVAFSAAEIEALSNRLRAELFNTRKYNILERDRMDDILKEQGLQATRCTESQCAVKIGQLLNVTHIILANADKAGAVYSLTVRLVSVESGEIDRIATVDCQQCQIEDVILISMRELALKLTKDETAAPRGNLAMPSEACTLKVTSNFDGIPIYVNGKVLGVTPLTSLLMPGRYHVSLFRSGSVKNAMKDIDGMLATIARKGTNLRELLRLSPTDIDPRRFMKSHCTIRLTPDNSASIRYLFKCSDEKANKLANCPSKEIFLEVEEH